MYSSPYNALPLPRKIHDKGWITQPEAQALFLKLARLQVDKAISRGLYEFTDNDGAFKEYAFEELASFFSIL